MLEIADSLPAIVLMRSINENAERDTALFAKKGVIYATE
jgi:hypothetical protein